MPVEWRWPDSLHLVPRGRASWQGFSRMLGSGTESHQCRTWSCCQYFRGLQQGILGKDDSLYLRQPGLSLVGAGTQSCSALGTRPDQTNRCPDPCIGCKTDYRRSGTNMAICGYSLPMSLGHPSACP